MWLSQFTLPHEKGVFGARRRHDFHTGIDFYSSEGRMVYALEDGVVTRTGPFTGEAVGMPWWHDTSFTAIYSEARDITILYGEINTHLKRGDRVQVGTYIGGLVRVLKINKGLPTTMLHLECYKGNPFEDPDFTSAEWLLDEPQPEGLIDPATILPDVYALTSDPDWGHSLSRYNYVRQPPREDGCISDQTC